MIWSNLEHLYLAGVELEESLLPNRVLYCGGPLEGTVDGAKHKNTPYLVHAESSEILPYNTNIIFINTTKHSYR